MLLVMHTTDILIRPGEDTRAFSPSFQLPQRISLWDLTWEKIATFMPTLQRDLFPENSMPSTTITSSKRASGEKEST
jgi:hypothetical protein